MARLEEGGSTIKQLAYARKLLGGDGMSKRDIAMSVGYSPTSANSVCDHIENKPGFHNAMIKLAKESNNLALAAMEEFKARGFTDFTNNELISALNAIGGAWAKFNAQYREKEVDPSKNRLRTLVLQQIENQTLSNVSFDTVAQPAPLEEDNYDEYETA